MTQPDLRPVTPVDQSNEAMHAEFASVLRFPLLHGIFGKDESLQYYGAMAEVGKLVQSVEPGQLVESNQEAWSQIRNIRSGVRRAMQESFKNAKEAQAEDSWFPRAVEHANRIPGVSYYFMDDVLSIYRDYQDTDHLD